MTTTPQPTAPYTETLDQVREFIGRNLETRRATFTTADLADIWEAIDHGDPDTEKAYYAGMAAAYAHVLDLIAPGRVTL